MKTKYHLIAALIDAGLDWQRAEDIGARAFIGPWSISKEPTDKQVRDNFTKLRDQKEEETRAMTKVLLGWRE